MHDNCAIADKALQCLLRYDWPGNIRELRNVIERSLILSEKRGDHRTYAAQRAGGNEGRRSR